MIVQLTSNNLKDIYIYRYIHISCLWVTCWSMFTFGERVDSNWQTTTVGWTPTSMRDSGGHWGFWLDCLMDIDGFMDYLTASLRARICRNCCLIDGRRLHFLSENLTVDGFAERGLTGSSCARHWLMHSLIGGWLLNC